MAFQPDKPSILGIDPDSLKSFLKDHGSPAFRATQILSWIYKKRIRSWDAMANVPLDTRQLMQDHFSLLPCEHLFSKQAGDVTEKLLLRLVDGSYIETVVIRQPQIGVGQEKSRKTVCISTQVGCAYGCRFCASGLEGWKRNLTTGEIIGQLIAVAHAEDDNQVGLSGLKKSDLLPFDNIVVMGMGEPLANYKNLMSALRAVNGTWGFRFGARRITVSTSGLVPQIKQLAEEPIQFRLALSLHAATNEVREQIMPVNRRYPLETLIPAVKYFSECHGRMLTLEYILIKDINDSMEQAENLSHIARKLHAHINLIPYNRIEGLPWERPAISRQNWFSEYLMNRSVSVTIRREKGHDIDAACGQLRLRKEKEERAGSCE